MKAKKIYKEMMVGILLLTLGSCGHDELYNPMPQYYKESQGLIKTDLDSVNRFRDKFQSYLKKRSENTSDSMYKPTVINMRDAYREFGYELVSFDAHVCVLIEYKWEEGPTIEF